MPTNINIGGASGKTWASVRAPLFTGRTYGYNYGGGPFPDNWSDATKHSSGYLNPYSDMLKAYPFYVTTTGGTGEQNVMYSTPVGINAKQINFVPFVGYDLELCLAIGQAAFNYDLPVRTEYYPYGVFIGNKFDYNTVKQNFLGAVVNLTYHLQDGTPVTTDVTITADMFPPDYTPAEYPSYPIAGGTYFQTISISFTQPDNRPYPWWTINSVTLP